MQAATCCLDLLTPLTHADPLMRDTVVWLCPLFRAVVRSEILYRGNFAELESSLDGPLLMFEEVDSFGTLSGAEQEKICVSLYFSISWLRQVINAFVTQDSQEVHEALCQRLLQSMMLQRKLSNYIKKSPRCATALLALLELLRDLRHDFRAERVEGGPHEQIARGLGRGIRRVGRERGLFGEQLGGVFERQ